MFKINKIRMCLNCVASEILTSSVYYFYTVKKLIEILLLMLNKIVKQETWITCYRIKTLIIKKRTKMNENHIKSKKS